ncbi:MAG: ElyC/SanA/YdcF family protein [Acidimicrobiales bacterium]
MNGDHAAAKRWARGVRKLVLAAGGVIVLLSMAVVWVLMPSGTPAALAPDADAVVMFAGGLGERLELAQQLVLNGHADVLVIPNGTAPQWPAANELCAGNQPIEGRRIEVICPRPEPNNTRGEARAIARLATDRGWDRLIAVTSSYHLRRARLLLDRCVNGELTAVAADARLGTLSWPRVVLHEWGGHVQARLFRRTC